MQCPSHFSICCASPHFARSAGVMAAAVLHNGQHVPESSGATYLNGGLQSTAAQEMPVQVSEAPFPGEYTGYRAEAMATKEAMTASFIAISEEGVMVRVDGQEVAL